MRKTLGALSLVLAFCVGALGIVATSAGASTGFTPATTPAVVQAKDALSIYGYVPQTFFCTSAHTPCLVTQPAYLRGVSVSAATRNDPMTPATIAYWSGLEPGQTKALPADDLFVHNEGTGRFVITTGPGLYGGIYETITVAPVSAS